jgi:subtilisin family serine protease
MLAISLMAAAQAGAAGGAVAQRVTYLVALNDPPLAEHVAGRVRAFGMGAPEQRRALRDEMRSADSDDYLTYLDRRRADALDRATTAVGRPLTPDHVYRHASNGFAVELDPDEAARLAAVPGVRAVRRERALRLKTDAGPQWIGADLLWSGQVDGLPATRGEGVVIGIIDTGINPGHPSFAPAGNDGFAITNPRGHVYGLCATGQAQCNTKLIGIYDFTSEGTRGVDSVGHGSHVAGIAAGNAIADTLQGHTAALQRNVSGVAPHANLIMYKGCNAQPIDATSDGTCAESALVASINQAIVDQVDVINYSIGGPPLDPYSLLDDHSSDAYAFYQARLAGIVVAVSAGNEGPDAHTVDEPGNAPWVIAVANASHNRRFVNSIGSFTGAANAPPTLSGQGYTAAYGPANIVYAGDFGNALCGIGTTEGVAPTGASNPFPPGTFHGEIVICDRGTYARVEKGYNVKASGAGGFVLANAPTDGESIVSDDHFLPAVHIGYSEGAALKAWVHSAGAHGGRIAGVSAVLDAAFGDILDASSSRGPYGFGGGVLKPDLTAPGDNILSAAQVGGGLALLSGTSMASPHVAGAAALVLAEHPDWSPAQVESALIGTALGSVRMQDGTTPASPLDAGAGRVQPALAARAGLYLPLNAEDFLAGSGSIANPTSHGSLDKLNRIGIEAENCAGSCRFTRTVTDMSNGGTWQVTTTAGGGASIVVTPNQFTLAPGASVALAIDVDVNAPGLSGAPVSGRIVLHKTGGGRAASDMALPVSVFAAAGQQQPFRSIVADAPVGSAVLTIGDLPALPQATFTVTSLVPATQKSFSLGVDPAPADVYTAFPGAGKQFVLIPNVSQQGVDAVTYGEALIVEIDASTAQQTHLYAGIDSNGDGLPSLNEEACHSVTASGSGAVARCVIDLRGAGAVNVWALVDIAVGTAGSSYDVHLSYGIPALNVVVPSGVVAQRLHATGPGHVAAAETFPLRVFWGPAAADDSTPPLPTGTSYGAILIDGARNGAPSTLGQSGVIPLSITRSNGGDDVADVLHPGVTRTLTYAGLESARHMFVDLPPGMSQIIVDSRLVSGAGPVSFKLVRADFPPASVSPNIAAVPDGAAPALTWKVDAATPEQDVGIPNLLPGRWYVVTQNQDGNPASVAFDVRLPQADTQQSPALTPGNYFNPQRSGHGIFMSRASGQQVVDWYTFLEDGTPAWYVASNAAPAANAGVWTATLYRVAWDGSSGAPTPVGDIVLTALAADRAMFSWHLFGETGSEAFQLIAQPACVSAGGNVNLNGEWFAPAQSGYGFDALVLPGQQFDAFYLYDASGNPRWVVGANGPFAAASTIPMLQSTGFCPVCNYQALTTQSAGSMTVTYANGSSGQLSTAIVLNAPLEGAWNVSNPIVRLTGSEQCTP